MFVPWHSLSLHSFSFPQIIPIPNLYFTAKAETQTQRREKEKDYGFACFVVILYFKSEFPCFLSTYNFQFSFLDYLFLLLGLSKEKMKGERMAKRSTFGSIMRRRLSDITNLQSQPKVLTHQDKPSQVSPPTQDLISKLIKEKMTLMKLIDERNKIIELSGNELQNLKINLQKLQLQNWNLAQSNSQMQAELNLGREKMKALQHELLCKEALLKAKNMENEAKMDLNCANTGSQEGEDAAVECLPKANDNGMPCSHNRRRSTRSKSMGPSTSHRIIGEKEKVENKRRCLRRQSARFKSFEQEPTENLFEINDTKLSATPPLDDPMWKDGATPVVSSSATTEESGGLRNKVEISHRSSVGRPLRRAAEKVQSYKEGPLNTKMRRSE
ncbi:SHUGOSHIN 2 isoform X2 [Mangifera indica]|uniref:SHUGOSHIN 2 isoform X2 n=1 Tax=Mangifera indica TaxID=29780 RepID=UPI001CFA3139|nr:SHUGOSHIN 2 isoform X2 [Mangifera indica]